MRKTLHSFQKMADRDEKIAALTCYDASFAAVLEKAGVDILLVGDSLGSVVQGHETTLPVSLRDMQYHTRCVAQGASEAYIVTDMPFGSYQLNPESALRNAVRLMSSGAHMVKLEGGAVMAETVRFLTERGIPVFGHIGLTPQSVHQLGGYRVQGKTPDAAAKILDDALQLQQAGASMMLLEAIPASLGEEVTRRLTIPTIGIGAGVNCSGQVLVLYDMLGIYPGVIPKFVKDFMQGAATIEEAVHAYVKAVKAKAFPTSEHSFANSF